MRALEKNNTVRGTGIANGGRGYNSKWEGREDFAKKMTFELRSEKVRE